MGLVKPIGSLDRSLGKNELVALAEANAQEVIDICRAVRSIERCEELWWASSTRRKKRRTTPP